MTFCHHCSNLTVPCLLWCSSSYVVHLSNFLGLTLTVSYGSPLTGLFVSYRKLRVHVDLGAASGPSAWRLSGSDFRSRHCDRHVFLCLTGRRPTVIRDQLVQSTCFFLFLLFSLPYVLIIVCLLIIIAYVYECYCLTLYYHIYHYSHVCFIVYKSYATQGRPNPHTSHHTSLSHWRPTWGDFLCNEGDFFCNVGRFFM